MFNTGNVVIGLSIANLVVLLVATFRLGGWVTAQNIRLDECVDKVAEHGPRITKLETDFNQLNWEHTHNHPFGGK